MRLDFIDIQNFRKLKSCRIDISNEETILVGPNNSGKTSAMDVLSFFLSDNSKLSTRDFTLNNWIELNKLSLLWIDEENPDEEFWSSQNALLGKLVPQIDMWLNVSESEAHHVHNLIPTLDWTGGRLGIRLIYEPLNLELLFKKFKALFESSAQLTKKKSGLKLWPEDFWAFLDRKANLNKYFTISGYILDPSKVVDSVISKLEPQELPANSVPIGKDALTRLIKVNTINAQRGFSDANSSSSKLKPLSTQLRDYYSSHLSPEDNPTEEDLDALSSIDSATKSFDERLQSSFEPALNELEDINYPGFGNPSITISSSLSPIDGISHESAVHFQMNKASVDAEIKKLSLPEQSNGLGYQNLISMVFELIRFRDEWMKIGKKADQDEDEFFEPLHLVLIEEPEVHLHAQIQQVFIKKAYSILRNHPSLGANELFSTQLVVSTHSNHIAHEVDFNSLRYFKRIFPRKKEVATSKVVNLSSVFGNEDSTTKFVIRYLRTTHCDLFFADAAILVEGSSERILLPHFIRGKHEFLSSSYLSILEIGGSHAHKLRPLIEALGVITLIITDFDPVDPSRNRSAVLPKKGKGYISGNTTISDWIPKENMVDKLVDLSFEKKGSKDGSVRVAYQTKLTLSSDDGKKSLEVYPTSFEDALVYSNVNVFRSMEGTGLISKFKNAANSSTLNEVESNTHAALRDCKSGDKARFALDLLFSIEPSDLNAPNYIDDGLKWLVGELKKEPII